ncbi:MAG: hypothetical protein F6K25_04735 [Okeania sp. SIO2G4]|uniref:thermonuclease family protein n=1 Tax=unclassified Okeania TaxID=2634635 RepID=UPI0013BB3C43|nr:MULTISPECIES: thermonuclease family protein [unclassified Okeania]NEP40713.1 hypothetical protein [Okeania sp. SIO2H7]NEP74000.1 hypothetical protein [Okeania sp. SIO2G5]NEP97069.1 hypothetical protein [Okeania sp. SIO2F5]NEQ90073.1 hypothetical protein [Okeania sp. SIO2G4]
MVDSIPEANPEAKSYLEQQVQQSSETVPTIFAGKNKQSIWYGNVWLGRGDEENSITALLLYKGLAKLSEDYYTCPNSDALKLAENLAREQRVDVWAKR